MERETGFEPATPSLEGWRSTAELFPQTITLSAISIAGVQHPAVAIARTGAPRTSLRPPTTLSVQAPSLKMVGRGGFEPPKAYASRFTVCPLWPLGYLPAGFSDCNPLKCLALAGGFEPPTHCLQGSCSTPELRQHRQSSNLGVGYRFVKQFSALEPSAVRPRSRGRRPPRPR